MIKTVEINTENTLKHLETPLQEGRSETGFLIGLYLEHLEDASFLYEQRISLLDDPELNWRDLDDFEERFEAHIDALVVGEELALATCIQQAIKGDFGELHAAVRVLCRWNNLTFFKYIIENGDTKDEKRLKAIDDALCHEMPDMWVEDILALFTEKKAPALYTLFVHVLGYRRIARTDIVNNLLDTNNDTNVLAQCAWALGRIGTSKDKNRLLKLFSEQTDETIREQAALALLWLKDTAIVRHLIDSKEPWAYILLGMSGTSQAKDALVSIVSNKKSRCPEGLLGVGLAGAVQAIDVLVDALNDKELAEAASQALYCITGAELFEKVEIEEEQEPSEENEDGLPPAEKIIVWQLSQNRDAWSEWLEENRKNLPEIDTLFSGTDRTVTSVVNGLLYDKMPKNIRKYLFEMIAIMSSNECTVEFDWLVQNQLNALEKL